MNRKIIEFIVGTFLVILGLVVMTAWYTHQVVYIQISSNFAPMQFNTALSFLLSGLGILFMTRKDSASGFFGLLIVILTGSVVIEYTLHVNLGVDELFIKSYVYAHTTHPGRMAPNTTLCFLLTGIFLFANGFFPQKMWTNQIALASVIIVGLMAIVSLFGYLWDIPNLYGWGNLTGMALHTTIGFIFISIACFPLVIERFVKGLFLESYFLSVITAAIGLVLFITAWQGLAAYQDKNIKALIDRDANFMQNQVNMVMTENLDAINRVFSRTRHVQYPNTENLKNDYNLFVSDYPALSVLLIETNMSTNNNLIFSALTTEKTNQIIKTCRTLLSQNPEKTDKKFTIAFNQDYLCAGQDDSQQLGIFDIRAMLTPIFSSSLFKNYGVDISTENRNFFSIENGDNFFRNQWKSLAKFSVLGKQWNLIVWPNEKFVIEKTSLLPLTILIFGLLIVALLAMMVRLWQLSYKKTILLEQYHVLFDAIDEGFCVIELIFNRNNKPVDFLFLQTNRSFEKQTDIKNGVGKRILEIAPNFEKHWFDTYEKVISTGEPVRFENYAKEFNRWYEVYAFCIGNRINNQLGLLFNDVTERRCAQEKLDYLAHHDHLTGLLGRKRFEQLAYEGLMRALRSHKNMAMLLIDLDHFKHVNDLKGHEIGDLLLQEVSKRFLSMIRKVDVLARIGGDEFALIIENIEHPEDIALVAKKMVEVIYAPFYLNNENINISVSVGIAIYPKDGTKISTLMRNADVALYEAKNTGKNKFCFFEKKLNEQSEKDLYIENFLHKTLSNNAFELHYQPIFNLNNNAFYAVEPSLFWSDPTFLHMSHDDVISIAQDSGLIVPIGEWMIKTAISQYRNWKKNSKIDFKLAIILYHRQLSEPKFVDWLKSTINELSIDPKNIIFELAESSIIKDEEASIRSLNMLRDFGCQIYIDDFGTGSSSLDLIRRLPIVGLKIDKRFIQEITVEAKSAGLVNLICSLGEYLNFTIMLEGLESESQFDKVKTIFSTHKTQGYYISHPLTADEIQKLL